MVMPKLVVLEQSNVPKLKNKITDNSWAVTHKNTDEEFIVDVSLVGCSQYWKTFGRKFMVEWAGGYADEEQNISSNVTTFNNQLNRLYPILFWATENLENKSLTSWTLEDLKELARCLILNKVQTPNRTPKDLKLAFRKKSTVVRQFKLLSKTGDLYRQGKLQDGLLLRIPDDFLAKIAESEFMKTNFDLYFEWQQAGTFAHIPVDISIALLSFAIRVLRSTKTNALRSYFKAQRGHYSQTIGNINFDFYGKAPLLTSVAYVQSGNIRKSHALWLNELNEYLGSLEKQQYGELDASKILDGIYDLKQLKNEVREIYDACMIIFLCLTGIRIHELRNINSNDYFQEPDGTWMFKTAIDKTHNGVSQLRTMSGLVAEAAEVLCDLSYIDKKDSTLHGPVKLFGRYDSRFCYGKRSKAANLKPGAFSREHLASRVNVFYQNVKSLIKLDNAPQNISPHGFRHAFVDFVIRRFDGNVLEAVRQHFRHRHGSSFTRAYTDDKAEEQLHDAAAKRYLKDLIKRMVGSQNKDFSGAMALYIRNEVKRLKIGDEEQLEEYIDSVTDRLEHLVPHEYGFCLVLKDRQHLAECKNKKTGLPNVGGAKFEWCSKCPNSFQSKKSNQSNIERLIISHESFLQDFPIATKQHSSSKRVVEQGKNILKMLES